MNLDPRFDAQVQGVAGGEAAALVEAGVLVLDVRTPEEFTSLGHIPGARLLPVHLSAAAPALLPRTDSPVLVCCEHAVRSRMTARLLAQAGFTRVYELDHGMAGWAGARAFEEAAAFGPSPWLIENGDLLPRGGRTLDVACGSGRHALLLSAAGFDVTAVDRDGEALDRLRTHADRLGLALRTEAIDLEGGAADTDAGAVETVLAARAYDLIIVTRYLHRPLVPRLVRALAPGGTLVYETFLEQQAERGHPTNPAFLLKPGELPALLHPLEILRAREGEFDGVLVSSVIARASA
jgi:rhodanese-related sulfurtransferase